MQAPHHLPTASFLDSIAAPTANEPLRVLVSSCLSGTLCGYDGGNYGDYPTVQQLLQYKNVAAVKFCPEHFSFGTPRQLCNIHGGTGMDVLDGRARILTEAGDDWTEGMILAANKMLGLALKHQVHFAVLMDISAACGSQVIYDGNRLVDSPVYQIGQGVCAALLIRNGIRVVSQRDYHTLGLILKKVDATYRPDPQALDHHQAAWYQTYFSAI